MIITGNVGKDPVSRYDANGSAFSSFSVAVSVGTKAAPRTDWVDVTCNGKLAETVQTYLKKGTKVLIEGYPSAGAYINQQNQAVATLRLYANNLEFLSARSDDNSVPNDSQQTSHMNDNPAPSHDAPQAHAFPSAGPSLTSDDIPF